MTTLADLRTDVRNHVDENDPTFWQDSELDRWVNEALREVARRSETLQAVQSYTIEADRESYPCPEDMLRIYSVEYRQSQGTTLNLDYMRFNDLQDFSSRTNSGGTPQWWSMWGFPGTTDTDQLFIVPIPSETISDGLRVYYYRLPRELADDEDEADIPAGWEDLVPLYVEYTARRKEAQDNRWQEAQQLFETRLNEMLKTTRHWTDQETFMTDRLRPSWDLGEWDP